MNRYFIGLFLVFYWCFSTIETIRVVCYFDSLATQREGVGQFTTEKIGPSLCTHLVYSKARINNTTFVMKVGDEKIDIIDKGYEKFVALKSKNPEVKILIGLGGWNIGEKYKRLHSNPENIETFVKSAVNFLHKYKFDGLHYDLQFLFSTGHKDGVTALLMALKNAFRTEGFSLSATVSPLPSAIHYGYHVPGFNDTLDFVNVMAFLFHGPWVEDEADHHSPLYRRSWDNYGYHFNADSAINKWIGEGIPPSKIVLGIALFGTSWTLLSNDTQPPALANGESPPGKILKAKGSLSYYEICQAVRNDGWQVFQDLEQKMGPYAVSPPSSKRTWVGYDDPEMAIVKSKYILSKGLGGASIWDLSQDDFLNTCGGGNNPILTAIVHTLKGLTTTTSPVVTNTIVDDRNDTSDQTMSSTSTETAQISVSDVEAGQSLTPTIITIIVMASLFIFAILCTILCYLFGKPYFWRSRDTPISDYSNIG